MYRFFVDENNIYDGYAFIDGEDVKHIKNVLRLEIGDIINLCDKNKSDYIVKISSILKDKVECEVIEKFPSKGEADLDIILYQGLPKATKLDLIIQKSTELGVKKIVPIITERTVVKIQDKRKEEKKVERWNRISEEAAKQSKRGIIPEVSNILTFGEMIEGFTSDSFIITPYENEDKLALKEVLKEHKGETINIVIGPEGGFSENEINQIKEKGAHIVSLGPRILRTETAGFTTIAISMYELGDVGVI